jgi:carboxyl-terminal processing protease
MKKEHINLLTKALLAFLVLSGVAFSVFGISNKLNEQGLIARIVANILVDQQYSHKKLDDKTSEDFFNEYIKNLDPFKFYFTKEDIKEFSKYKTSLDDMVKDGDVSFAVIATDRLLKRVKEYQAFAKEQLKKGFDFTKNEDFLIKRKDAEFPTASEQKELWRKKLKNDYLNAKLIEKISKENIKKDKLTKEEKDKEAVKKLWKKTPEERILKRISSTINMIKNWEDIDKLELFINSLAHVYDPHSSYMSPKTLEDFDIAMQLSLIGIGAVLTTEDGYTKVVRIIKGGPASKNGKLEAEDRIIAVGQNDDPPEDVVDMPLSDVVQKIRGKKNTKVRLTIIKGKKGLGSVPEEISLIRDKVKLEDKSAQKSIKEINLADKTNKKIGIIELPSFYINFKGAANGEKNYVSASRDVKRILEEFKKENIDGIILDLRNNGGGGLIEAIRLTGLFFDSGPVVQVKGISAPKAKIQYDLDNKTYFKGPLVVIVNKGSASATEILAGALQDYGRAIIVGDGHTHGKGTVQTVLQLNNITKYYGVNFKPGALKLTNAMFYRINGDSTQIKGVIPDIILPSFYDALKTGERNLEHAIPFGTVPPANYIYSKKYTKYIPQLKNKSEERRKKNKKFTLLKSNIDSLKTLNERKMISLNMDKRWKEYKKEKEILDKEVKTFEDNSDKTKDEDKEDIILDESIHIMSDLLTDIKNGSKKDDTLKNIKQSKKPELNPKAVKQLLNSKALKQELNPKALKQELNPKAESK